MAMRYALCLFTFLFSLSAWAQIPSNCSQLIVSIAPDWNSDHGRMQVFERKDGNWTPSSAPIPVLFGKNGLIWGRGIAGQNEPGPHKQEKDRRAPAGIFRLGTIYTADAKLPAGANYPFHQITENDAWVDDPTLPEYNRHIVINPANPPSWFQKQKMRLGDFAYRWLVEIRHNSDSIVPGGGSAIFFHIRRGEQTPTSGCTTMAEGNLQKLICWLKAGENPCYVLLPRKEYLAKMKKWNLPDAQAAHALLTKD
ncbi:MAG: L,D-transpeptidase family protein [Chthoniobacterales bacterium]